MAHFSESLCEEVIRSEGKCGLTAWETLQMARFAIQAIRAQNPLLLDALRYRWLRDNMTWFDPRDHIAPALGPVSERIFYHASGFKVGTIDEAVDAAMGGSSASSQEA